MICIYYSGQCVDQYSSTRVPNNNIASKMSSRAAPMTQTGGSS